MKAVGYVATTLFVLAYSTIMNGWALAKLWSWFIVSTFGVAALSIPAAIGFSLVVSYLTQSIKKDEDEDESFAMKLLTGFLIATIKPLFALGFGAIIRAFL